MDFIIIPSYEPTEKLVRLIEELKSVRPECQILVVNDGSAPEYDAIFSQVEALGVTLLRHEHNRGKGAALKTGFAHLLQNEDLNAVVCADSDGQHKTNDIFLCLDKTKEHPNSMIIGTRKFKGHVPMRSRFGNTVTRMVYLAASGTMLYDTQTGLRAFAKPMLPWLMKVEGDRFEYEMNMLLEAPAAGIPFHQLEIETVYDKANHSSHFRTFTDSFRVYYPIVKFSSVSIVTGLFDYFLLLFLHNLGLSLLYSVLLSRITSGIINYWLNKVYVFSHKKNVQRSALRYTVLAAGILAANYLLLRFLTETAVLPLSMAKIFTEMILWFFSFWLQRLFVFSPKPRTKNG